MSAPHKPTFSSHEGGESGRLGTSADRATHANAPGLSSRPGHSVGVADAVNLLTDKAAAAAIYRAYKDSNLPCRGEEMVASIRAEAFARGAAGRAELLDVASKIDAMWSEYLEPGEGPEAARSGVVREVWTELRATIAKARAQ